MAASVAAPARPILLLAAGAAALALASLGEAAIERGASGGLGPALYLAAIVLFAFGAFPRADAPEADAPPGGRFAAQLLAAVSLASAALGALLLLRFGTRSDATEVGLWLSGLALLAAGGVAARNATAFPARWETRLPHTRAGRAVFAAAAIALLAAAAAVRVTALGRIPAGINADEGDRAAVGIWMLRGDYPGRTFESGWYHVSNVYFRILAAAMDVFGTNVPGARMLGALCGLLTVGLVLLLALRHFGWRAALLAEAFAAFSGVALQFSRETTEATPTATLWTLSALLFLEAARAGPAWAWVGAGMSGGLSIYFYSPGRLWPVLAALVCVAFLLEGGRRLHKRLAAGVAVAALAALLAMAPFLVDAHRRGTFAIRARETSVFVPGNRERLSYMKKEWSLPRVLVAQVGESFRIFGRTPDANYFWPSGRPILPGALSVLTLLGLGAAALKARDSRMAVLTAWFAVGFAGLVVTVETPALQRMACAVPVLALFPALVLDDVLRRVSLALPERAAALRRLANAVAAAACLSGIAILLRAELVFYFETYGPRSSPWAFPNAEGTTVAAQGPDSWVFTLGPHYHKISQGWVTFLAPATPKAGLRFPGRDLPLAIPANRNLVFVVYPNQSDYLPFLRGLYPEGVATPVAGADGSRFFTVFRVPREAWRRAQGALAIGADGRAARVDRLGEAPPGVAAGRPLRWAAVLRVSRTATYGFRAGGGRATLEIDGARVLGGAAGPGESLADAPLLRGDHAVTFEAGAGTLLEWREIDSPIADAPRTGWEAPATASLRPSAAPPGGLLGAVTSGAAAGSSRLAGTLATADLVAELGLATPFDMRWTGTLTVPSSGVTRFAFRTGGAEVELRVDGVRVWKEPESPEILEFREAALAAGPHAVSILVHVERAPAQIEWIWSPPGEPVSIVPSSVLAPPAGTGMAPAPAPGFSEPRDQAFSPRP